MPARQRPQQVNPRLGIYFGIFVAALAGLVILLLMLEQLGMTEARLRGVLTLVAVGFFAVIGALAYTNHPFEFFLSGRRVPSFFVGLALAIAATGGTGLVAFSGTIFLAGFDALCLPLGIVAGFVAMVVLIAPYLRKFGAFTVPGYLGMRFESVTVRLAAASVAAAALILLVIAELKVAMLATSWLFDLPEAVVAALLVAVLAITIVPGGVRSLSWSGAAQSMVALLAVLVPATVVGVIMTNLPLGQLSHGPVLRALGRTEIAQGIPALMVPPLAFELPGQAFQPILGRFASPFGTVGPAAFVLAILSVMIGIAGSPAHLGRAATTPSVYDARKSIGWSVFIAGVVIMTLSALAVFLRDVLLDEIAGASPDAMPAALKTLIDLGLADIDVNAPRLSTSSVAWKRDGTLISLPILMKFPAALVFLAAAGVLAAALAGAAASATQLGLIISEDVIGGAPAEHRAVFGRLMTARIAIVASTAVAGWCAAIARTDPLELMLWSLAVSASALFPVLLLSIWWKRANAWGAASGIGVGLLAVVVSLLVGGFGPSRLPTVLVAVIGVPISVLTSIGVSLLTPAPSRHTLEIVRDLRVPGGETVYDREMRYLRQRRARRK